MDKINFTIIIPHKNIPQLLKRCLDSIPRRDDIQVIVVDDHSDSAKVDFDHFPGNGQKNTEIYFRKKSGGAGAARNTGLEHARGKWLIFADADDFFSENINEILDQAVDADEDLLFFYPQSVLNDNLSTHSIRMDYVRRYFDERDELALRCKVDIPTCKIIRRSLVEENAIRFHEVQKSNDVFFSSCVGSCAKKLRVIDELGYIVTERTGSLTNKMCRSYSDLKDRLQEAIEGETALRQKGYVYPTKSSDYFMMLGYVENGFLRCLGFCVRYMFSGKVSKAMASYLVGRVKRKIQKTKWYIFHKYLDTKVFFIRRKKKIRFCFILRGLTNFYAENLYLAMLEHPRFEPVLCIAPSVRIKGLEKKIEDYCKAKGYKYVTLSGDKTIGSQIKADFVMHEQPYYTEISPAHTIEKNWRIPVVSIPYFLNDIKEGWFVNCRTHILCWRMFLNAQSYIDECLPIHRAKGVNFCLTGLPMVDRLLEPKEIYPDVWPSNDGRKRIIYAPHHTIGDIHWEGIAYSTFLDYCRFMLELRDKYKDKVYFVFKPHPRLRYNLVRYWGEEKTDAYYAEWEKPGVSHVVTGDYMLLFKYSDALIHDCSSFTVEYMYTGNPVLYLLRDENHTDNLLSYTVKARELHYKAERGEDIEKFIVDVINGNDPLKEKRQQYKQEYLLVPNGKSACENIINSILGN